MADLTLKFTRTRPDAVVPTRGTELSVGLDLTVVGVNTDYWTDAMGDHPPGKTIMYDTGIIVQPPPGYYTEVHERSSFHKSGFKLANTIGIIDEDYRGPIYLAVRNDTDQFQPLLHLCENPKYRKGFQLIMKKAYYPKVEMVEKLDETERGDGGFGSTS